MKKIIHLIVCLLIIGISESLFSQIPNERVTNNCWYQNEPMVAINTTSTNKMVCGYIDSRSGNFKLGWSWSDDGGFTWTFGANFTFTGYTHGADPVVAFDNTGTAYITGMCYNFATSSDGSIFIAKSNDGGHTFNVFQKIVAAGSGKNPYLDKPWLYINPFNNDIYLTWVRRENYQGGGGAESMTIWFTRSTDGGQNFSSPIQVSSFSSATGTNRSHGPQITVTSANNVLVSWHTLEEGNPPTTPWKIWITESTDGGVTFGTNHNVLNSVWGLPNRFISMDADPSSGMIYIVYADSYVQSPREYDIYITSSTSVSGPWSTPVKISDDLSGRWQMWPSLDIAANGRVDVVWYDYRDNPNGLSVYYSSSLDAGITWSPNVRITDVVNSVDPFTDQITHQYKSPGDYICVASLNERAQIVWMDNRNTCTLPNGTQYNDEEIYTATVIMPTDSICFPPHRGVPGSTSPPTINGKVQEDVGWRGAYRITYGNGTNAPHVACQTLKHKTDNFIYISFEVRNDPTFDNNDAIVITFRPDISNGLTSNDRKIVIYPICDNEGAAGPSCTLTTPDDKTDREPRQIKFYRNSQNWAEITASQIQNLEAKVRSYTDGSTKAWNVELKVPTSTTTGGSQWVNFTDEFLFYFNVIRVENNTVTANEFRWPRNSPEINGDINLYPFYPWEWGKANKSNTALCNGVSLSHYSDIGTTNAPSSEIKFTSPTNTQKNTFYANVRNNSEIGGIAQQADDVLVRFRIANWGISGPNDWADIIVSNPVCPNIQSNPTCPKDIPAATSAGPGIETFNLEWTVPDSEVPNYQAHDHQCILVELDSRSNTKITTKSIYRNMDFVQASLFTRSAEISARGYGQLPQGFSKQKFAMNVITQEYTYGGGITFDTLKLEKLLHKKQFDEKKPVSVLNYNVHGYRYTGRTIIINEHEYDIIDPVGSFGYVVSHKGLVKEWKHKITGCELIQPDLYELNIPSEEKATVVTEIEPVDYFKKWSLSLHAGLAIPTGSFANDYNPGFNVIVDVDYHFSTQLSLVALFGYNDFKSKTTGIDDNYWINVSANLKYRILTEALSPYLNGGPGYYIPKTGDGGFGFNLGAGLDYNINNFLTLEVGADYHTVFQKNVSFLQSRIGLILRF